MGRRDFNSDRRHPVTLLERDLLRSAATDHQVVERRCGYGDDLSRRTDGLQSWPVVHVAYRADMTRYVIDPATLLHLVEKDMQVNLEHQIVAPNLIRSQALTLLLRAVRRGDLLEGVALNRHERITELKMRLLGDRVSRRTAWSIAREQCWETTYEAEYLAVTKLQADAFITIDRGMREKAAGIVPLASIEALITW